MLLTTRGPLNCDETLLSSPPSTDIERLNVPSSGVTMFMLGRLPISSPSTVLNGVSKISSLPVIALYFLLREYEIPLSFIPV